MNALQYALNNSAETRKEYPEENAVSITRKFLQTLKMQRLIAKEFEALPAANPNAIGGDKVRVFGEWLVKRYGREVIFTKTVDLH